MNRLLAPLLSLSLTATVIAPLAAAQEDQPEAVVELATVVERDSSDVLRLPGTVISTRDSAIAAELSGRLTWVAEVGEQIAAGQPVAKIDDHLLQLELRNNLAEIARIQADIHYNQRQQQRLERLAKQNNMAQSELDQVQSQLEMLRQDLSIAEVNRDRTEYDLQRSQVLAPFSGVVVSRSMSQGEYTSPGSALVRLVDTKALEVSVNAPLRVARFNPTGSSVQVESEGRQLEASIRGVVPVGDARSRMMELRLSLEPGHWYIGEAVTVELPQEEASPALSVPRDALVLRDDKVFVYTMSTENKAVKVPVVAGAGKGSYIAVEGELEAGDPVVIRGAERLKEGQNLRVIQHHLAAN